MRPVRGRPATRAAVHRRGEPGAVAHARRGLRRAYPALALGLVLTTACDAVDRLLTIETPSRLAETALLVPANAELIVNSAVGDFQCAYGAYVVASGLAAGELTETSQTASRWSYDRRDVRPSDAHYASFGCETIGVYTPLNTARYTTDQALAQLEAWTDEEVPNRQQLIARAAAFAGYSTLLIGEAFCTGVIGGGDELTTAQLFDSAEVRFTRAITAAQAVGDTELLNLARVGRARARLDGGDMAGAAEDAAAVPADFLYALEGSDVAGRFYNRVFAQNNASNNATTVAPAYRDLTVQGIPDPRVPVRVTDTLAGDQQNTLARQLKYESLTDDMILASGVEAQLILAEATGGAGGVAILNSLRTRPGVELPALTAEEQANFTATLFEERRRELWLQGTRWYDLRRGNLPLVPPPGAEYVKGGTYGDQRCWPLPDVERLANSNVDDTPPG